MKRMAFAALATWFVEIPLPTTVEPEGWDKLGMVSGLREDLADVIYNISPSDTPFMTALSNTKATHFEWTSDALTP